MNFCAVGILIALLLLLFSSPHDTLLFVSEVYVSPSGSPTYSPSCTNPSTPCTVGAIAPLFSSPNVSSLTVVMAPGSYEDVGSCPSSPFQPTSMFVVFCVVLFGFESYFFRIRLSSSLFFCDPTCPPLLAVPSLTITSTQQQQQQAPSVTWNCSAFAMTSLFSYSSSPPTGQTFVTNISFVVSGIRFLGFGVLAPGKEQS